MVPPDDAIPFRYDPDPPRQAADGDDTDGEPRPKSFLLRDDPFAAMEAGPVDSKGDSFPIDRREPEQPTGPVARVVSAEEVKRLRKQVKKQKKRRPGKLLVKHPPSKERDARVAALRLRGQEARRKAGHAPPADSPYANQRHPDLDEIGDYELSDEASRDAVRDEFALDAVSASSAANDYRQEYDLAPEPEPPKPLRPLKPKPTHVVGRRPCRTCGYDLQGLELKGRCPECGTPVVVSKDTANVAFANSTWARKLVLGLWLIVGGIIGSIFLNIVASAVSVDGWSAEFAQAGVGVVSTILIFVGTWLATEPDPSGRGEDEYGTSRKAIRIGYGIESGLHVLALIVFIAMPYNARMQTMFGGLELLGGLFGVVALFFMLKYLGHLARRIPEPMLADRSELLFWGYGGSNAALTGIALAILSIDLIWGVSSSTGPGVGASIGGVVALVCMAVIVAIVWIVFGVMYLLLLARMAAAIDAQRRWGDEYGHLNSPPPPPKPGEY